MLIFADMKLYQLHATQTLPITRQAAWDFLSNPANLKTITPDSMGFTILSGDDQAMYPGQIIAYRVTPFSGYSTKWVTEITHVKEGAYFVDEQRFGPYTLWHHKHFIKELKDGVLMEDIIDYKIPLGFLGQLMHPLVVKKQLLKIFRYREQKLTELFGSIPNAPGKLSFKTI